MFGAYSSFMPSRTTKTNKDAPISLARRKRPRSIALHCIVPTNGSSRYTDVAAGHVPNTASGATTPYIKRCYPDTIFCRNLACSKS